MKTSTIFITYNPKIAGEHTLAVRLHTIGAVNGFRMYLPDRFNSDSELDTETQRRINLSDYMVFFSLGTLSPIVKAEIKYAYLHFQDKSKIIVIYDSRKGKNLKGEIADDFTSFQFNPLSDNQDLLSQKIMNTIFAKQQVEAQKVLISQQKAEIKRLEKEKEAQQALSALLGIGLGLFVLGALIKEK